MNICKDCMFFEKEKCFFGEKPAGCQLKMNKQIVKKVLSNVKNN